MSSNLLKQHFTYVKEEEKRVIDSNELVARKLSALLAAGTGTEGGFLCGLNAQRLEGTFPESTEDGEEISPVIKAQPEEPAYEEERERLLQETHEEIERMRRDAQASLEQERQRVLAEAKEAGYREGTQRAQQEYRAKEQQLGQEQNLRLQQAEAEYQRQIDRLEPEFIDTLTGIYEHIFHVDLQNYREILVFLIGSTLRKAEGGKDFIVHVSSEDYPYVSMQKKQLASAASAPGAVVEVIEDVAVGKNECLIETNNGIFDCGLETELQELTKKLKLLSYERPAENG